MKWEHLHLLLKRHKLLPVSEELLDYPPNNQKSIWRTDLHSWAIRSMLLFQELTTLYKDLDEFKIKPIAIKGPVLAFQLYGKINGRQYSDLDLIIQAKEIPVAIEAFLKRGYQLERSSTNLESINWDKYFKTRNHIGLIHPDRRIFIELHTGVHAPGWLRAEDEHILFREPISIDINGPRFLTLNPESNFFYLCYHGAKHMYFRLSWLKDVAEILEHWKLNHPKVLLLARELNLEKLLGISLLLAKEYFNTSIPSEYNDLHLDSWYYRSALKINIAIINGPPGYTPISHAIKNFNKESIQGVSNYSLSFICNFYIYKIFYRRGFLTRLKHYLSLARMLL